MTYSERSDRLISDPSPIMVGHLKCLQDPFSSNNPDGYLNFGTAENDLLTDKIAKHLGRPVEVTHDMIHYGALHGYHNLRSAFSNFAKNYLDIAIDPEGLIIQNGVSSLCESLSYCLLNPGDQIMIFSPYYAGFDFDFAGRFGANILPIPLSPVDDYYHHIHLLEQVYSANKKVKALLICHPHNPTGRILSDNEIKDIIYWCKANDIHLISDEIYALSMIKPQKKFKSFLHNDFPKYEKLHFLYGMAKDFSLGGYKVGYFWTSDTELFNRMKILSYFHCVSSHTQKVLAEFLSDRHFLAGYISENQEQLAQTFVKLQNAFPHFKAPEAGLFCYTQVKQYASPTLELENKDWEEILNKYKISILPGHAFHDESPGYFRICFAKPAYIIEEFIKRLNSW